MAYCLGTDSSGLLTAFVLLLASYQDWQNGEVDIWPLWALFFWQAWHNWSQFEPLLVLGIFCLSLYFIYVRKALGAGDLPVLLLLGLGTVVQFASATLAAACSALIYIYLSKRPAIPFIPFLTLGYFCSYLCQ
ncbi:hypothetical protein [Eupransor demetentiae]|uniref:hypothetical protein n=1 Tax=Eupransor demetentiae TaxID=3109584 RepID=UPI0032E35F84